MTEQVQEYIHTCDVCGVATRNESRQPPGGWGVYSVAGRNLLACSLPPVRNPTGPAERDSLPSCSRILHHFQDILGAGPLRNMTEFLSIQQEGA